MNHHYPQKTKELTPTQLKQRDRQDLINAGAYNNGQEFYLDADGHPRTDILIPWWFHNMSKAWKARDLMHKKRQRMEDITTLTKEERDSLSSATFEEWNNYCNERVDHGFPDPRDKEITIRKPKRSDLMRKLLAENGFVINYDKTIDGYEGFSFLQNGRIKYVDSGTGEESRYSVHWFVSNMI